MSVAHISETHGKMDRSKRSISTVSDISLRNANFIGSAS
jgi:hypothetical protein